MRIINTEYVKTAHEEPSVFELYNGVVTIIEMVLRDEESDLRNMVGPEDLDIIQYHNLMPASIQKCPGTMLG